MFQPQIKPLQMNSLSIKDMIKANMHLGHPISEWNPRMKPFILEEKNGHHLLDLVKIHSILQDVLSFIEKSANLNKKFLFIGTKKSVASLISEIANSCNSFYVNKRWLGGMLTNWKTIQQSLRQLQLFSQAEKSGDWNLLKKKEISKKKAELAYLEDNLTGLKNMQELPDIAIIVGQPELMNAVKECIKLGIETVTFLDTNCDPTLTDWYIPVNDDSHGAIKLILNYIKDRIIYGQQTQSKSSFNELEINKPDIKPESKPSIRSFDKSFIKFEKKPYNKFNKFDKKPYNKFNKKPYNKFDNKSYNKFNKFDNKSYNKFDNKSYNKFDKFDNKSYNKFDNKSFDQFYNKSYNKFNKFDNKSYNKFDKKPYNKPENKPYNTYNKPYNKFDKKPYNKPENKPYNTYNKPYNKPYNKQYDKSYNKSDTKSYNKYSTKPNNSQYNKQKQSFQFTKSKTY